MKQTLRKHPRLGPAWDECLRRSPCPLPHRLSAGGFDPGSWSHPASRPPVSVRSMSAVLPALADMPAHPRPARRSAGYGHGGAA